MSTFCGFFLIMKFIHIGKFKRRLDSHVAAVAWRHRPLPDNATRMRRGVSGGGNPWPSGNSGKQTRTPLLARYILDTFIPFK